MSEAQKYQGHLYRGEKKKGPKPKGQEQALVPHQGGYNEAGNGTIAVVDVPPKAPSPPPTHDGLPPGVNVFDFLVKDTPAKPAGDSQSFVEKGYSYGAGPVEPTFERYDSYAALPGTTDPNGVSAPSYATPGPKQEREERKSDKKRKRDNLELNPASNKHAQDQGIHDAPDLHTGLTGGLNRMLSGPNFSGDDAPTPLNPDKKRSRKEKSDNGEEKRKGSNGTSKTSSSRRHTEDDDSRRQRKHRHRRGSSSSEEDQRTSHKHVKAIEYRTHSVVPHSSNQIVAYHSPAELFMSFVSKGPDSERGLSINKALKRYHREQEIRGERDDDKDLWKGLRIRKNDRGEVVLFI